MSITHHQDETPSGERLTQEAPDGRSRRRPREDEPGFFEQLVTFLRPRVPPSLREELVEALMGEGGEDTGFSPGERLMLTNILKLHGLRVEDVMVSRTEIDAVPYTATLAELMARFEETGRSRMPVYGDGLDDPLGMVHIRDMMGHITRSALCFGHDQALEGAPVRSTLDLARVDLDHTISELGLLRKVLFVPPSMHAAELMSRMQASHIQMALVIDEYGGTDGLVSLEDILEIVVGDIEDEHDDDEVLVTHAGEGVYYADARADLEDVQKIVGPDFDVARFEAEAETIGGMVVHAHGGLPEVGAVIEAVPGFEIEVLETDPRRIKRLRIVRFPEGPAPELAQ